MRKNCSFSLILSTLVRRAASLDLFFLEPPKTAHAMGTRIACLSIQRLTVSLLTPRYLPEHHRSSRPDVSRHPDPFRPVRAGGLAGKEGEKANPDT
jgi:hypothetical protein